MVIKCFISINEIRLTLEYVPRDIELILLDFKSVRDSVLIEDFNLTVANNNLQNLMSFFDLECLIKKPTCFHSSPCDIYEFWQISTLLTSVISLKLKLKISLKLESLPIMASL